MTSLTGSEIATDLMTRAHEVIATFTQLPEDTFFTGPKGRWSAAQHLGHLSLVRQKVNLGLQAKEQLPEAVERFGTYDLVRQSYLDMLARTPAVFLQNNPFRVDPDATVTKADVIATYSQYSQACEQLLTDWQEEQLSQKAMKHPLLGLLSVREMLYFVHYHEWHHMQGIQHLRGSR